MFLHGFVGGLSRRQFEFRFRRGDDEDILPSLPVVEDQSAAVTLEIDALPALPPGDIVMAPLRIGEPPQTAIVQMDEILPHETEIPSFESFSVHENIFDDFAEKVNI